MKTLLVDGNSLFKNSFEATRNTKEYEKNINGVLLFLSKLRSIVDSDRYSHLKIVFDGEKSGSLRRNLYSAYKLKREERKLNAEETEKNQKYKSQKEELKSYLKHFCLVYEDKVVEADDVIAYYVRNKPSNEKITIVTGDFDLLQLISKDVDVYYLNKKFKNKTREVERYEKDKDRVHLIIDHKNFKKFYGFPYENIAIIKTICGDESDEIKNVKGIKETTLFNLFPVLKEKVLNLEEIKHICLNFVKNADVISNDKEKFSLLKEDLKQKGLKYQSMYNSYQNILNGITDGVQGNNILEINKRIVDLANLEFITDECILNLKNLNYFSDEKIEAKDATEMISKMKKTGIHDAIVDKYKSINYFFKPFKKTFKNA
jgi:5'-3' exonuclease